MSSVILKRISTKIGNTSPLNIVKIHFSILFGYLFGRISDGVSGPLTGDSPQTRGIFKYGGDGAIVKKAGVRWRVLISIIIGGLYYVDYVVLHLLGL